MVRPPSARCPQPSTVPGATLRPSTTTGRIRPFSSNVDGFSLIVTNVGRRSAGRKKWDWRLSGQKYPATTRSGTIVSKKTVPGGAAASSACVVAR